MNTKKQSHTHVIQAILFLEVKQYTALKMEALCLLCLDVKVSDAGINTCSIFFCSVMVRNVEMVMGNDLRSVV